MTNRNVLRRAGLPLLAVAAGAVGGVVLGDLVRGSSNGPSIQAGEICPAHTTPVLEEPQRLLSKAEIEVGCENDSGELVTPLRAGYPDVDPLDTHVRAAPLNLLSLTYEPGDGGGTPKINNLGRHGHFDVLQLGGANAIVEASFVEP